MGSLFDPAVLQSHCTLLHCALPYPITGTKRIAMWEAPTSQTHPLRPLTKQNFYSILCLRKIHFFRLYLQRPPRVSISSTRKNEKTNILSTNRAKTNRYEEIRISPSPAPPGLKWRMRKPDQCPGLPLARSNRCAAAARFSPRARCLSYNSCYG